MKKKDWMKTGCGFFVYMAVGMAIIAAYPHTLSPLNVWNYAALTVAYFIVAGLLLLKHIFRGLDLFEPLVFITVLYLMIFCITPIMDLIGNTHTVLGVDTFSGCLKGTFIFAVSYIAFYLGYLAQHPKELAPGTPMVAPPNDSQRQTACFAAVCIWLISYVVSSVPLLLSGRSALYIATSGIMGENLLAIVDPPLGFMGFLSTCLIPAFMYVLVYGKSTSLKAILFVLTFTAFLVRGFRYILIVTLFAPAIYYYLQQNKRPGALALGAAGSVAAFMIGIVGFARRGIRYGTTLDWAAFDFMDIVEAIKGNFEIYKPFYGLVTVVPDLHDYTWGEQLLFTFVMLVPRAIWPDKPDSVIFELTGLSVNNYAIAAGAAWPNIGEFYSEFGVAGSVVCMLLFGMLCGWCRKLYQSPARDDHSLIAYSILLPAALQVVIRGYTPANFYLVVFLLLPILLIKWLMAETERRARTK